MVIWCAYCQRFQGEREPFDDAGVSHGLCASCAQLDLARLDDQVAALRPVIDLLNRMWTLASNGRLIEAAAATTLARTLGIRPVDMLVGLVAPLLAKVGRQWADGTISVAEEHQLTAFFGNLIRHLRECDPALQSLLDAAAPDILLVNGDGNFHTLGLRIAELWLAERGVSSRVVVPGIPVEELAGLIRRWAPRLLGLSIALPEQLPAVRAAVQRIAELPSPPRILIGGFAVKSGAARPGDLPGATMVPHLSQLAGLFPTAG